jgi:hypothetical protein
MESDITLKVSVEWSVKPEETGGSDDRGNYETIPAMFYLTSVKANGHEILPALDQRDIDELIYQIKES